MCLLADDQGQCCRRGAPRRREPAGVGGTGGREGPPRGDGGGDRRSRDGSRRDLSRHRWRRSPGRLRRRRGIMQRIGHKARVHRRQRRAGGARGRGAGPARCRRHLRNRDRFPTAATNKGEAARSGGWGYVLGDEGSGYWIGRAALRAVLREADRRGPATVLSGLLLKHFGVGARAGIDSRGLQHELEADGDWRARAMRAGGVRAGGCGRHRHPPRRGERARDLRAVRRAPPRAHWRSHLSSFSPAESFVPCPWLEEELERRLAGRGSREPGPAARPRARHRRRRARAPGSPWRRSDSCL